MKKANFTVYTFLIKIALIFYNQIIGLEMQAHLIEPVKNHPSFRKLQKQRKKLGITLTLLMLFVYFTFILTIAFKPEFLARPLYEGSVITLGIPLGIFVIIFAFVLTGVYVRKANITYDEYIKEIHQDVVEI